MELRHIRYFLVLAEELNFSRAAERLHIAQPSLSRQIKELENELEATLFYRDKRQVELTNAGKVFLKKANHILDQVEQACISTRLSSTGHEGEFRIGFTGSVHDLIPILKQYRKRFPKVGIVLQHLPSNAQIEALNENRLDIALISIPVNNEKIETRILGQMNFMVALPENHHLAAKPSIFIRDLAKETFIITPKSSGSMYYEMVMSVFKKVHFVPQITIQAHDLHTVLALVASGMGITLTPSPQQSVHGIVNRKVEDVHLNLQATMAWRKDNRSEILEQFLLFISEYVEMNFKQNE